VVTPNLPSQLNAAASPELSQRLKRRVFSAAAKLLQTV